MEKQTNERAITRERMRAEKPLEYAEERVRILEDKLSGISTEFATQIADIELRIFEMRALSGTGLGGSQADLFLNDLPVRHAVSPELGQRQPDIHRETGSKRRPTSAVRRLDPLQ